MFIKLPTIVLVAVAAGLCLAAPAPDADGLSVREAEPQIEGYPNCGAPICKRDGAYIGFLSDAEVDLVNRAADNCGCPNGKVAFLFHGHCQCAGDTLNYTGPGVPKLTPEAFAELSEEKRDFERRGKCVWENCQVHSPSVKIQYDDGHCGCAPQGHIPPNAHIAKVKRNVAGSEESSKRDVLIDQASQLNQTSQVEQGTQIDCQKRLRCPPGGHSEKINNRCLCRPNKKRDVQLDQVSQLNQTSQVEQGTQIDCQKRLRCPPGGHSEKINNRCLCRPNKLKLERDTSSLEERTAQPDDSMSAPLDCASIAKCPGGQHPVNNASDGMCECVDDDAPDAGMMDCAAIAKCPGGQHPVFNNNAGMCQCIPDGTQLDCASIAKCSGGAHPINYNGGCICVPDWTSQ